MDNLKEAIRYLARELKFCKENPAIFFPDMVTELEQDLAKYQTKLYKRIHKRYGFLFNRSALWVGVHYSPFNKRYCVNLLPCVTIWFCCKGGKVPHKGKL